MFAVIAVIALGAVSLFAVNKLTAPSASTSPQATIEPTVSPPVAKQAATPPPSAKTAVDSQVPTATAAKPEATPPVPAAGIAASAPTPESTRPLPGPTATAEKTTPRIKPKTEPSPAAPVSASVAPDRNSPRCSRIMEKATLGETLTTDEKKELASSCR